MNHTSLTCRLLTGAAGLVIAAAGAFAVASPASAQDDEYGTFGGQHVSKIDVAGEAECVDGEWIIEWTVTNNKKWKDITVTGLSAELEGLAAGDVVPAGENAAGYQTLPGDTAEATLDVDYTKSTKWGNWDGSASGAVELGECVSDEEPPEQPEVPELVGEAEGEFDCETATVVITNDSEVEVTFTVQPSEGDAVEVTVGAGEASEEISFASSEGLTIDILVADENDELVSVIEEPFEITSEAWAELGCEEDGEGGELPVTGSSTTLIAGGAVVLLAVGGGLFLVARRRRVTFTA